MVIPLKDRQKKNRPKNWLSRHVQNWTGVSFSLRNIRQQKSDVSQGLESCLHFISASRFVASERGVADFAGNVSKVEKKLYITVN